jgi:hypothetical protein
MTSNGATRAVSRLALATGLALGVAWTAGCRTTSSDIQRWGTTEQGPRKLVAVLTHDKYPLDLRVEAALTLVTMKPRDGRNVGIDQLQAAMEELPPVERGRILNQLVPELITQMQKPPPRAQAGQAAAADPSFPYKDAAFALLTQDDGSLISDDSMKTEIKKALANWCLADFSAREGDSSQMYGVDQVLRALGSQGVERMPDLIEPGAKDIDRMADLIANLGDQETKVRASQKLVAVAKDVDSDRWLKQKAPAVEAANKTSKLNPTAKQFQAQLDEYQEEELLRVFGSMKKVGGTPAVNYLIDFASNKNQPPKRRAAAIAALEGNIDKNDPKQIDAMLEIASGDDTPDEVRDQALRRVGEMPRKMVVGKLYDLFRNKNWRIRWVAAELVLRMSDTSQVAEFMRHLSRADHMAITEPLRYGELIGQMKGPIKPVTLVKRYIQRGHAVQARLSALGYFYSNGIKSQLSEVTPFDDDHTKVPGCKTDDNGCEWKCSITEGSSQEVKDVTTVGEFVKYCIEPAMEKRTKAPQAPSGKTKPKQKKAE